MCTEMFYMRINAINLMPPNKGPQDLLAGHIQRRARGRLCGPRKSLIGKHICDLFAQTFNKLPSEYIYFMRLSRTTP